MMSIKLGETVLRDCVIDTGSEINCVTAATVVRLAQCSDEWGAHKIWNLNKGKAHCIGIGGHTVPALGWITAPIHTRDGEHLTDWLVIDSNDDQVTVGMPAIAALGLTLSDETGANLLKEKKLRIPSLVEPSAAPVEEILEPDEFSWDYPLDPP
jgi:hypothetical protein